MRILVIKPHHFIDILRDLGAGREFTPHPYGHAFHVVAQQALADHEVLLEFTVGADDICRPCTHNTNGVCDDRLTPWHPQMPEKKEAYNRELDGRWMKRLGLREGQRMKPTDYCRLIEDAARALEGLYPYDDEQSVRARVAQLGRGVAKFLDRSATDVSVQEPGPNAAAGARPAPNACPTRPGGDPPR